MNEWINIENKVEPKRIVSSGFAVRSQDGKYLMGKTEFKNQQTWTIFKGQTEGNESLIETAIRELREETGIDINKDERLHRSISTSPIHKYSMKNKDVYIFLLDDKNGALNDFEFRCDSYWGDNKPEILEFKWFDVDEMYDVVFYSQKGLVDVLKRMDI